MGKAVTKVKIAPNFDIKEPNQYKIIYINDDVTTMEFVVETLVSVFEYGRETATELTMKVHDDGSAVVAVLPYEMAEQKGVEVTVMARNAGFPLTIKLEADE